MRGRVGATQIYGARQPTPEQERRFFGELLLANGTCKTTYPHRLDDLNEVVLDLLPESRPLKVKDVGVSTGISSLELLEFLRGAAVECEMTATDLYVWAKLTRRGPIALLSDLTGNVLQVEVGPLTFLGQAGWRKHVLRPLGRLGGREVRLVSRELPGTMTVLEEDLFEANEGSWDVIRVANILNRSYFSEDKLRAGIRQLAGSLNDQGLLAICRTDITTGNHATVFRRVNGEMTPVAELGEGSEIKELVSEL